MFVYYTFTCVSFYPLPCRPLYRLTFIMEEKGIRESHSLWKFPVKGHHHSSRLCIIHFHYKFLNQIQAVRSIQSFLCVLVWVKQGYSTQLCVTLVCCCLGLLSSSLVSLTQSGGFYCCSSLAVCSLAFSPFGREKKKRSGKRRTSPGLSVLSGKVLNRIVNSIFARFKYTPWPSPYNGLVICPVWARPLSY